jgi:hypothetical protein
MFLEENQGATNMFCWNQQGRIPRGIHGLPNVHARQLYALQAVIPETALKPFQGWPPPGRAASGDPSYYPFGHPMPYASDPDSVGRRGRILSRRLIQQVR